LETTRELNRPNPNLNVIDVTRMNRKEKKDGKVDIGGHFFDLHYSKE
jgi:hypothetical protein